MRKTLPAAVMLVLALQGCSAAGDTSVSGPAGPSARPPAGPSAVPPASATSGIGGAPAPAGALDGKRQVVFLPRIDDNELPDAVLAVTPGGRIQVTDEYADRALFVPVPTGGAAQERLIKTATLRNAGKPFCLQVSGNGADPLTVVTAACDRPCGPPAKGMSSSARHTMPTPTPITWSTFAASAARSSPSA